MTMPSPSFHQTASLPPYTVAIMVHKLFQDRVVDYLLSSSESLLKAYRTKYGDGSAATSTTSTVEENGINSNKKKRPRRDSNSSSQSHEDSQQQEMSALCNFESTASTDAVDNNNINGSSSSMTTWQPYGQNNDELVRVLYTQRLTGVSQARRGYVLLLLTMKRKNPHETNDENGLDWCRRQIQQLSPMARQNISFVCYMTHQFHVVSSSPPHLSPIVQSAGLRKDDDDQRLVEELAKHAWAELVSNYDFDLRSSLLRVEVHPRRTSQNMAIAHFETDFCYQLERQAWLMSSRQRRSADDDDVLPFTESFTDDAPIVWIKSKSKCTHQLTLIVVEPTRNPNSSASSSSSSVSSSYSFSDCYWGIECRNKESSDATVTANDAICSSNNRNTNSNNTEPRMMDVSSRDNPMSVSGAASSSSNPDSTRSWHLMDVPLNHQAAQEIVVVPCHPKTGEVELLHDQKRNNVTSTTSRTIATSVVLPLSRAYYKLHQVWKDHLESNMESYQLKHGCGLDLGACPGGWTQVLVELGMSRVVSIDPGAVGRRVTSLPHVTHIRTSMEDACANGALRNHGPYSLIVCDASVTWTDLLQLLITTIGPSATFTLPSVWVVTIKLPFKTIGSIQRHVASVKEQLPNSLQELKQALYPNTHTSVTVQHQLLHLMANSDCERTVLAVFEPICPNVAPTNESTTARSSTD